MTDGVDPDRETSSGAGWSGSALFAGAGLYLGSAGQELPRYTCCYREKKYCCVL